MTDYRRFFVITSRGEVGPFTVDDLKEEVAAQRITRTDRLRTAFGANLGTVGEAVGPAPRNQRRPSDTPSSPASVLPSRQHSGPHRVRTSTSNRAIRDQLAPTATTPRPTLWLAPLAIGLALLLLLAYLLVKGSAKPSPTPERTPLPVSTPSLPSPVVRPGT